MSPSAAYAADDDVIEPDISPCIFRRAPCIFRRPPSHSLSPLDFSSWAKKHPSSGWQEIEDTELEQGILDWLADSVSARSGITDTNVLAKAFIFLMTLAEIRVGLKKGEQPLRTRKHKILAAISKAAAKKRLTIEEVSVLNILVEDLADIEADVWPETVYKNFRP